MLAFVLFNEETDAEKGAAFRGLAEPTPQSLVQHVGPFLPPSADMAGFVAGSAEVATG